MNLRPSYGAGNLPLIVHTQKGSTDVGGLVVGQPAYLDWYIENSSFFHIPDEFETHVYVDGVLVDAWASDGGLTTGRTVGVWDWDGIAAAVNLAPGPHTFRLVVDALNQVAESDEADNIFEREFTFGGAQARTPDPGPKAINVGPTTAEGLATPLVISGHSGANSSGLLTVDGPTYVSWAVENRGLASTGAEITMHLYYDDIVVQRRQVDGLPALSGSVMTDWDGLGALVRIEPGIHALRLVVDPGNLVQESDETDNEYSVELEWATGPPPAIAALPIPTPIPAPAFIELTKPNLKPLLGPGWDAPLVVKSFDATGTRSVGLDAPVSVMADAYVGFSFWNASAVGAGATFRARLLLDDAEVYEGRFTAGGAAVAWSDQVPLRAGTVAPGEHALTLVIDPLGSVTESDEGDNRYERVVEWLTGPVPSPESPTTYSDDDLREMLASLPELLLETATVGGNAASARDWGGDIGQIAGAAYYLATGRALADERLTIETIAGGEYRTRTVATCLDNAEGLTLAEYETELASCRAIATESLGNTGSWEGKILVLVDTDDQPAGVLNTLLHELGHARQRLVSPDQTTRSSEGGALPALYEAEAQVFEAVGWRHIEAFLGISVDDYPGFPAMRDEATIALDRALEGAASLEEHDLGYVLIWLAALQDPGGLGLSDELRTNGRLSAESTKAFYDYLLSIDAADATAWVDDRLSGQSAGVAEYREIALGRLVEDLPPDDEGHPDLRGVGFLAP